MGRGGLSGERPWRRSRTAIRVAAPAAGADWSLVVPAGHRYDILSVQAQLVTAVAVANRQAALIVGDGTGTILSVAPQAIQAASLTDTYTWFPHGALATVGGAQVIPIPELSLGTGWSLGTLTGAIQAADQWSAIIVQVDDTWVKQGTLDFDDVPDLRVEVVEVAAS